MIELKNITKTYHHNGQPITVLHNINLTVQPGEIVGVIGKSGAGKSTLLRCVNLLEKPTSGEVWVNSTNLTTLPGSELRQARAKIGMIFQHFNLLSSRTTRDNIALPLELNDHSPQVIQQRVDQLLELTGLSDRADNYPSQLSGGQKQRTAIARALANQPNILLCDEITSALDPETTASILKLIRKIQRELNISILFISHDMEVIKSVSDRVIVLDQGHIAEETDIINIFKNPKSEISKALTQAALHCELPTEIRQLLHQDSGQNDQAIIRIKFLGKPAVEPIIDDLIRDKHLKINILQANLEYIRHETVGMMIIGAEGKQTDLQSALTFLNNKHCQTELLGYVNELKQ